MTNRFLNLNSKAEINRNESGKKIFHFLITQWTSTAYVFIVKITTISLMLTSHNNSLGIKFLPLLLT